MPTDLYYFYESDLDKGNLIDFVNSLPKHLKEMFKESMGGVSILDRDSTNVLQGYRGPDENGSSGDSGHLGASNGLQEVRYWWGVSKHLNWVPILGSIVYGAARAAGDTKWHSLYFDSKTGECLSHDKEVAASKLNDIGRQLFDSGKFNEAKEYFSNAYTHSHNKANYDVYKNNENKAQAAVDKNKQADLLDREGNELHKQGKYEEAYNKFDQAYKKCTNGYSEEARFKNNRDIAKNNWAEEFNKQGNKLWEQNNYSKAVEKYNQAYQKCTNGYKNEQAFKNNRDKAQAEVEAINLSSQGDDFFRQGEYSEAQAKYQEAYDKSEVSREYNKYSANRDKAKTELDAIGLKELGDKEFNAGRYDSAKIKYQQAYDKSSVAANKTTYTACINKTKAELDAIGLKELGDKEFNAGRYDSAKVKYQQACDKSSVAANKTTYTDCINKTKAELNAIGLKELGDKEFNAGRYDSAKVKYQQACDKSSVVANKTTYTTCINKSKVELDALSAYQGGENLFSEGKYSDALRKYQDAYSNSKVVDAKSIYKNGITKAQVEINAKQLYEQGDALYRAGNYLKAKMEYNKAVYASNVNKEYYRAAINKAKAELDAVDLNNEGNALFASGDFSGAKDKYQQAYDRSEIAKQNDNFFGRLFFRPHEYKSNKDKAQTELDAIALSKQASILCNQGKFVEAIIKYQEAYDKSQVSKEYNKYKANINKAKYKSVFADFSLMLSPDITDSELKEFAGKLEIMIDEGYGSDTEIVNRFHIISLRVARKEMNSQLESINQEDITDLIEAIMNLIDTEIEVLKKLNITDQKLEQELNLLEEKLSALELDLDNECEQDNTDNRVIDITSIASRVEKIDEEIETRVFEKLGQKTQLEHGGNALELRYPLIAPIVETYLVDGMNEVLQLRISVVEVKNTKRIKLLSSNIINIKINNINLYDIANQLAHETDENEITVIPLLVKEQNVNVESNINHWVGLISEHRLDGIIVSYLDSEKSSLEGLSEYILDVFKVIHPNYKTSFREITVEQQRYNNCGSELIENIILYITGSRADQESAIYLHSSLWEQSLILADIETNKDKEFSINYDDIVSSISECTNLSGSIKYDMEN